MKEVTFELTFPRVTDSFRGTGPPSRRTPTVLMVGSGTRGGSRKEEAGFDH